MKALILNKIKNLKEKIFHTPEEITQKEKEILDGYIRYEIHRAKELGDRMTTTVDEKEFFSLFDKIADILTNLTQYEDAMKFSILPSDDLKSLLENKGEFIELLHQRIQEGSMHNPLDAAQSAAAPQEYNAIQNPCEEVHKDTKRPAEESSDPFEKELGAIEEELKIIYTTDNRAELNLSLEKISSMLEGLKTFQRIPDHLLRKYKALQKIPDNEGQFIASFDQRTKNRSKPQKTENFFIPPISESIHIHMDANFDAMEGHEFEHFCAKLLQKNGFNIILSTPDSGDQGIDIVACKEDVKYGIQCKRHSSNIGNGAVQEAFAGAAFYGCHVPVVLTNRYFTQSAVKLSSKTHVLLWNRTKLLTLINNAGIQ